ncbi:MAG: hypothetical protein A2X14_01420 [Bacteroidetes bacterium GWD2_33_33]|nr:MAG: hypothetical protein A2X14_01420 [Bacteroidetes bacterium GWD2_33_33]
MDKFRILIIFLSTVIFFSCEENESNNPNDNQVVNYWPMEVGNYWTFVDSSYNSDSDTWRVDTVTWFVSEKVLVNGKEYFSISVTNNYPAITSQIKWLFNIEENNIIAAGGTTPFDTLIAESVLLKNTEIVGETWPYYHIVVSEETDLYVRDTVDMKMEEISELNNTKYGILNYKSCSFNFNIEEDIRTSSMYFSNNIGLIRIIGKENDEIIKISNLIEYNLE